MYSSTTAIDENCSNVRRRSIENLLGVIEKQNTGDRKNEGKTDSNICDEPSPLEIKYGWVVVLASFICIMTISADGLPFIFKYAFTRPLVEQFEQRRNTIQNVIEVNGLICHLIGPCVSALIVKFGVRSVCIAGSVVSCFAFILSSMSTNINVLLLTYGVIGGIGFGMIYLPALVVVGHYFDRKITLASGMAFFGSDIAWKVFIPLAYYLSDVCNWIGYNLVLSLLILICALCGAFMKKIDLPNEPNHVLKPNSKMSSLAAMADLSLLRTPEFLIICFSNLFAMASFHIPFIYLSYNFDGIDSSSFSHSRSALDSATESLNINFMARVVIGYLAYFNCIRTFTLHNMSLFISASALFVFTLGDTYLSCHIAAYLFVLSISAFTYLTPAVLTILQGQEKFTNAFGWILFFRGVGTAIGLKLAQELYNVTKTITGPLYLSSAIFLISSATSCFALFLNSRKIKRGCPSEAFKNNSQSWSFKSLIKVVPPSTSNNK